MSALPSLKQLHYLVALADELNFTRAAQCCFVSQSTLSAGLKELEALLDARLVERDRQNVLMTPLGQEVAERARSILSASRDLVELTAAARAPMASLLRLGVIPTVAPFLLPRAMRLLRSNHADLKLALREDVSLNLLPRIEDGLLDFALIALPFQTGNLLVEPLFDDPFCLVGRPQDAELQATAPLRVPPLERLLLLEEGHCLREHTLIACGPAPPPTGESAAATSLLTLVQMVESGLGLGLLPSMAAYGGLLDGSTLVLRSLVAPAPHRTIALVARRSTSRGADLQALAQVFRSVAAVTPR